MPSLQDERDFYTKMGWTWTKAQEPAWPVPYPGQPTRVYGVKDPDIHGDTEGDDLWTYLVQFQRTGQPGYLVRAQAWARYFKDDYRQCVGGQYYNYCFDARNYVYDHMYGWGLLAWFQHLDAQHDPTARSYLEAAEALGSDLEVYYREKKFNPGSNIAVSRDVGRHLLLLSRLYDVTGQERWKTLVAKIVGLLITTSAWSESYGIYWSTSRTVTNNFPAGAYSAGVRVISPWMMGIIGEGMAAAYRVTGEPELRRRMVKIAQFVAQYGPHPEDGFIGYLFGVHLTTKERIWVETHGLSKTTPPKWTGAYSTAVTNLLVRGYQYSGDVALLDAAKRAFACGTHWGFQRAGQCSATFTTVGHFVDTVMDKSAGQGFYLAFNKGELFYSYLLLTNGGNPSLIP